MLTLQVLELATFPLFCMLGHVIASDQEAEFNTMLRKAMIGKAVVLILQMIMPCIVRGSRSYGCMEGYCAMANCRSSSGSGWSNYCWIAADSAGNYLRCGGREECRGAAQSWGNCKAASCQFDRAPDPFKSPKKTCESMNSAKANELKSQCRDYSQEKWLRDHSTPRVLYAKFDPCIGQIVEGETKKVIKYCLCYNNCGKNQTENGACEVQGLERRLDFDADIKSTYVAVCKIDCEPVDKYVFRAALKHGEENQATVKYGITKGMTSSKTTSTGGSSGVAVSGEVGLTLFNVFSAKIGVSSTTGYDWSSSSTASSFEQETIEISVPVDAGKVVSIYQVIGVCENSDGTTYTIKTSRYETRGENGEKIRTADLPSDE